MADPHIKEHSAHKTRNRATRPLLLSRETIGSASYVAFWNHDLWLDAAPEQRHLHQTEHNCGIAVEITFRAAYRPILAENLLAVLQVETHTNTDSLLETDANIHLGAADLNTHEHRPRISIHCVLRYKKSSHYRCYQ